MLLLSWQCKGEPRGNTGTESKGNVQRTAPSAPSQASALPKESTKSVKPSDTCSLSVRKLVRPLSGRLVAIGDVHGDMDATRRALRMAGAIDESDQWIGGTLTLVQTGDVLDRGDDEQEILDLFIQLKKSAAKSGGSVIQLNGNHELMNAMGDFRYVTRGGYLDFIEGPLPLELTAQARAEAFLPGGRYAKVLSDNDMVAVVGDTVFVHGGVMPQFVGALEKQNRDSRCFLLGEMPQPPTSVTDPEGPLWSRDFSSDDGNCDVLEKSLASLGVKRMVVGHTPQLKGITSACDEQVWRIDTGMASYYQGPTEVLEVVGNTVRVLSDGAQPKTPL